MSFETLKDKIIPFFLGVAVLMATTSTIVTRSPVMLWMDAARSVKTAATVKQPPAISNFDINSVIAQAAPTATPAPTMTLVPTLTIPNTPIPTSTPSPTSTPLPTASPMPENGQIIDTAATAQITFKGKEYTVQMGEGLSDIAMKAYGDPNAWSIIAKANNLASPDLIEVGMKLKIPRNK